MFRARQRKTVEPCPRCRLHRLRCLCAEIPRLALRTHVTLVVHHRELKRTTNTGSLAVEALVNSTLLVRGRPGERLDLTQLEGGGYPVLLYPAEGALDLASAMDRAGGQPLHLIVPDGNWRQASKVHLRHGELKNIPRVILRPPQNLIRGQLRAESAENAMATLQAIALALGEIEGPQVGAQLMKLYQRKVELTLLGRGQPCHVVESSAKKT